MNKTLTGKLVAKNFEWWLVLDNGKQMRVYYAPVINSSDYFVRYKGKKYGVDFDFDNMTATVDFDREFGAYFSRKSELTAHGRP